MAIPDIEPPAAAAELISLSEAADLTGRKPGTIRTWMRRGKLTRHQGVTPARGGSPPVMVDRAELLRFMVVEDKAPAAPTPTMASPPARAIEVGTVEVVSEEMHRLQVELAAARSAAEVARLEGEVQAGLHQVAAEGRIIDQQVSEIAQLRTQLVDLRADRDDWRERHDARASELAAIQGLLQAERGRSWWQKLLGGPVAEISD